MEMLIHDVYEKILVRLDVKNLMRCKSVCKSWKFVISDPCFVKAHLNHNNNENGQIFPCCGVLLSASRFYIVGSSNGLVCIRNFCSDETLVINPATREEKMLPKSQLLHHDVYNTCWGFGYDSVTDDYKVVFGVKNDEKKMTCFQVLSLKSNAWKHIGQVKYRFFCDQRVGIFCNGTLNWAMYPKPYKKNAIILSFDLSSEEFKEIPLPDDPNQPTLFGIMEECLCLLHGYLSSNNVYMEEYDIWVMQKDDVKQSWRTAEVNCRVEFQIVDRMTELENDDPNGRSTHRNTWFFKNRGFTDVPNIRYVESLVSPHL
ncbi:F-box protein CPR1-like protein [Tanacetum coccineum]